MNKSLIALILFISNISVASEKATISGKILNHSQNEIIGYGQKYNIKIDINQKGEFEKTFDLKYVGIYHFDYNGTIFEMYISNGNKINFSANERDFINSLTYTGNSANENNYLKNKQIITSQIINSEEELYKLNENEFLEKVELWENEILKMHNSSNFKDQYFSIHETKNIDYMKYYYLKIFSLFHRTESGQLNLTEKFPIKKLDFNFDFNNTEDYVFSEAYMIVIDSEWSNHIEKLSSKSSDSKIKIEIEEIKKIENEYFKNKILNSLHRKISPTVPDLDYLYNELQLLIKSEGWKKAITEKYNKAKKLTTGVQSPAFDFENFKGGKTTLENLKGKYVYIDIWATWCGPCRKEIPSLQSLEEKYHGKNIEFVSISIDTKKDYEKWRKFVEEKQLGGIQLFADNDWNSKFVTDYAIEGIPRFILVDPKGNITSADAPRPSDLKLVAKFDELGIK